jgi:hypothetical protein
MVLAVATPLDSARWWRSHRIVEALRLTPAQADAIERIYRTRGAQASVCEAEATHARAALERRLMTETVEEPAEVAAFRAADAEATCRRGRTLMLFEMYQELSVDQRRVLAKVAARRTATRHPAR